MELVFAVLVGGFGLALVLDAIAGIAAIRDQVRAQDKALQRRREKE